MNYSGEGGGGMVVDVRQQLVTMRLLTEMEHGKKNNE